MAGPRCGRPTCIRAALSTPSTRTNFRKGQRRPLHRLKAGLNKHHLDFADSSWREAPLSQLLDPSDGELDAAPWQWACRGPGCAAGGTGPPHAPKPRSPEEGCLEGPPWKLSDAGWASASLGATDVDMQPVEASGPEVPMGPAGLPGAPADLRRLGGEWGPRAAEHPDPARHTRGRARAARAPRLGSERDRMPKLSLSKRKLELLLAEPEKHKRRKQHVS
ncbi:uncharacterized protein LOC129145302 isoform X1 [Talpa occidentalis]|uniref:uncharacterized protein LOC129145302 isoform X1 n=1 Tax=Talpa occidentalis TaxID=50954 RepID=UPI0023F8FCCE|nr:uncharacterized protein LOC129145302 isoform X1 [Talpa occidentalis]